MKLTKTCAKFLRRHGGTILAVLASAGVVATAVETSKATIKAQKLIEMNTVLPNREDDSEPAYTPVQKVKDCWKFYLPAAILGGGTIACILGSNALNKKQIASLTAAYMALGKTYQEYRRMTVDRYGADVDKDILADVHTSKEDFVKMTSEEKLLCYDPLSKRYFHATEAELLTAFYEANHDFVVNGYIALNDFYGYLGLDFIPELDGQGWSVDYMCEMWDNTWIHFSYAKQHTDDGLEVYYVTAFEEPIEDYMNFDPYEGLAEGDVEKLKSALPF